MKKAFALLSIIAGVVVYLVFRSAPPAPGPRALTALPSASKAVGTSRAEVSAKAPKRLVFGGVQTPAETIARAYVLSHQTEWGIQPYHRLDAQTFETPLGAWVKYQPYQGEYPIFGMQIQVRVNRHGEIKEVRNSYRPMPEADLTAFAGLNGMKEKIGRPLGVAADSKPTPVLLAEPASDTLVAAVAVTLSAPGQPDRQALVRVTDGQVLSLSAPRIEFVKR
ncbi:hypothetical protein K2X33_01350 [bacterium]|nr:hypothetical protein [bacterium]